MGIVIDIDRKNQNVTDKENNCFRVCGIRFSEQDTDEDVLKAIEELLVLNSLPPALMSVRAISQYVSKGVLDSNLESKLSKMDVGRQFRHGNVLIQKQTSHLYNGRLL